MDIQTQSALLATIITLTIATSMQIRGRRSRLHSYFAVFNYVLALWNATNFLYQVSDGAVWFRLSLLSALLIPGSALRFFRIFLASESSLAARASTASLIISVLLVPFVASPLYEHLWLNVLILVYVIGTLYLCMFFIYRRLRMTQSRLEGARLSYLVVGGLVAITFSLTDYLPKIDVFFPALGNVFTVLFVFFLSQILIHYRLLDLTELFGKIAVVLLLGSVLAANYGVLIYWVGDQPGVLFFTSLVASFVVLILFEPLRMFVEARMSRYNLRERFKFERQLAGLRRAMANVFEVAPMVQLVFERLENSRRITHASLMLLERDGHTYRCAGSVGPPPPTLDAVALREAAELLREGALLVREEVEDDLDEARGEQVGHEEEAPEVYRLETLRGVLDALHAGVVLPIISDQRLIGLLTLWNERTREAFSRGELQAVQQVAQQIAIVIENSRLVEKLRERDRLAALGEMSAGLAHEIRNPLGAIKGAAQLLTDPETDLEEIQEFSAVIVEEVDRLNNVVSQFLDYARPDRTPAAPVALEACVERTIQLLRKSADLGEVEIEVEIDPMPPTRGDRERLTQVFLNLGLNGLQAMKGAGTLTLQVRLTQRREPGLGASAGWLREVAEVRFEDTGEGMSPEELNNIFIPFFTTKPQGTGLGLPICQRIVRSFGGTIEVQSTLGAGSVFSVLLPLWGEEAITGGVQRAKDDAGATGAPMVSGA